MRRIRRILVILLLTTLLSLMIVGGLSAWTHAAYAQRMYSSAADLPRDSSPRVAIVFGAGLERNGGPTPILYDRVATAAELYKAGRVTKLLLSGDNRFVDYNEPEVMRQTAVKLGVPNDDLVLDYAGRRTYDSCYRARDIFGVNHAILVTQAFHLDRALYICNSLGIDSLGLIADRRVYDANSVTGWQLREAAATLEAWIDVNIAHPVPVLGDKIPIGY